MLTRIKKFIQKKLPSNRNNSETSFFVNLEEVIENNKVLDLREFEKKLNVRSMTTLREKNLLLYLSVFSSISGDIVEIGSWVGGTTCYLAKGCQLTGNGIVYAIDHFQGNVGKEHLYNEGLDVGETIYDCFLKNINQAGVANSVTVLNMNSEMARKEINESIRMLFIDANHDYEFVKKDIILWEPLLKSGGYIVFHDYNYASPGVIKAVNECLNKPNYQFFLLVDSLFVALKK